MGEKKKFEDEAPGTPEWIVTFTDLMSLLLTFFVLLLTFSTPRIEKLFDLRGSIEAAFGIVFDKRAKQDDRETWVEPNPARMGRDMQNPYAPALMPRFRPLEDNEPNRVLLRLKDQSGQSIDWDRVESGYRLTLREAVEFAPGERDMTSESFIRIQRVAKAVEFIPYRLMVIGVVGTNELSLLAARNEDPYALAIDRAISTTERLAKFHNVNRDIIGVSARVSDVDGSEGGRVEFLLAKTERFSGGGF